MAGRNDYVSFLFTSPLNRSFAFKTYTSPQGSIVGFVVGKDQNGNPIYHRWKWDQDGARTLSVHKNRTDINGQSAVDFLRNSPNCLNSPLGSYGHDGHQIDIYFREVDDEKSAAESLDAEIKRVEAQNLALKVKGQDFVDLCALIGVINKDESIMRFSLVDFAKNKPEKFTELYNDPVRQIKSVLRRGVDAGIIVKEGRILSWENQLLGVDEDEAVSKLAKEDKLLKALKTHLDKVN